MMATLQVGRIEILTLDSPRLQNRPNDDAVTIRTPSEPVLSTKPISMVIIDAEPPKTLFGEDNERVLTHLAPRITHNLNNSLTPIIGNADMILERVDVIVASDPKLEDLSAVLPMTKDLRNRELQMAKFQVSLYSRVVTLSTGKALFRFVIIQRDE